MPRKSAPADWPKLLAALERAWLNDNPDKFLDCALDAARGEGMNEIAELMGIDRPQLYAALSRRGEGHTHRNPAFAFMWSLFRALGLEMKFSRGLPPSPATVAKVRNKAKGRK